MTSDIYIKLNDALSSLVSSTIYGNRVVASLPVVYPSGAHAAIELQINGQDCFISDIGQGYNEAENYGAAEAYKNCAKQVAERYGVNYDGFSLFVIKVPLGILEAAVVSIANASVSAARMAIDKAENEKSKKKSSDLFDRVSDVFGKKNVTREMELKGRQVIWPVNNVVEVNSIKSVFEFVSDHQNSISNKYMKFSDLSSNENQEIILNAVMEDIENISNKGLLIGDVANIIPINATNHQFMANTKVA